MFVDTNILLVALGIFCYVVTHAFCGGMVTHSYVTYSLSKDFKPKKLRLIGLMLIAPLFVAYKLIKS